MLVFLAADSNAGRERRPFTNAVSGEDGCAS